MKVMHKENCSRVFKRYDPACPRCQELINGEPARKGWGMTNMPFMGLKTCSHNNLNPGGYCMTAGCGAGGDWS